MIVTEQMKKLLNSLKLEEKRLRDSLTTNSVEQRKLAIEIYIEETGIDIGDRVRVNSKEGEIVGFKKGFSGISPHILAYKKDGTLGVREIHVWFRDKIERI